MAARIVVAEDTPALRDHLAASLSRVGYQVRTAADGAEVLALVEEQGPPELIILDLTMPAMDGATCLRHLRQTWSKQALPVIVLSANAGQSCVLEVVKLGISDYLLKSSYSHPTLLERVARALRGTEPGDGLKRSAGLGQGAGRATPSAPVEAAKATKAARDPGGSPPPPVGESPQTAAQAFGARAGPPDLKPLIGREALEHRIRRFDARKGFSPAIGNLLKTIDNPNATLTQIAESASIDHALAAKVIWWANSVACCRGAPVSSVRKAVVRIGTNKIRETALTLGILERFGAGDDEIVHHGRFWEHSVTVAAIAAELVRISPRARELDPDVAFTTGLLHDVGRLVLVEEAGDLYGEVLRDARRRGVPLVEVERAMLHSSHAQAAEYPLRRWHFTNEVIRPVILHHLPVDSIVQITKPERLPTAVLALADNLARAMLLGDSGEDVLGDVTGLISALGLSSEALLRLESRVLQSWRDLRAVAAMCSRRDWPDQYSVLRDRLHPDARPRLLDNSPVWSVHRQLFTRLFGEAAGGNPNLWVARLELWDEIESHIERIAGWERTHSKGPFPLILIAPADGDRRSTPQTGERPVVVLPSPLSVGTLIRTVNELLSGGGANCGDAETDSKPAFSHDHRPA